MTLQSLILLFISSHNTGCIINLEAFILSRLLRKTLNELFKKDWIF